MNRRHPPEEPREPLPPLFAHAAAMEAAHARADLGMTRAAEHAEKVEPGWREQALEAVRLYAASHERFLAEHVHLPIPTEADGRAAGAIMQEAARRGWIRTDGWGPAATSNGTAKRVWRSLIASAP